jgi:GDP-mannose 6-dehydrogenase
MRVSVFGLGYDGCVSAACLARNGHTVIGVDAEPQGTALARIGHFPVLEPGLDRLIVEFAGSEKFRTTVDARFAVLESEISLICVGTRSNANGSLNLQDLDRVCRQIGGALAVKKDYHLVVVRSAVLPGTVEGRLILLLEEHSDRKAGDDFGICMNSALLRDQSGVEEFDHPSQIVIGELDTRSGDMAQLLYQTSDAPIVRTTIRTAEMLNYVTNAFHAVKVTFANEIGNLCAAHGIDGQEVMEYFCRDRRLNISSAYLRPGFAFGGPRLPKDLRALIYRAKEQDVECPLLNAVLLSNQKQIFRAVELVEKSARSKVAIVGLGIKAGLSHAHENPIVRLAETLMGKGYQLRIFDEDLDRTRFTDTTTLPVGQGFPHILKLIRPSLEEVIRESEVIVVGNHSNALRNLAKLLLNDQILIDLAGVTRDTSRRLAHIPVPVSLNEGNARESVRK